MELLESAAPTNRARSSWKPGGGSTPRGSHMIEVRERGQWNGPYNGPSNGLSKSGP